MKGVGKVSSWQQRTSDTCAAGTGEMDGAGEQPMDVGVGHDTREVLTGTIGVATARSVVMPRGHDLLVYPDSGVGHQGSSTRTC